MRSLTIGAAAAMAAATLLLVPAGASAGSSDNRCRKAADRYTVVKKTKFGAIFYKRVRSDVADRRFELYYACLYSTERLRLLPGQDRSKEPARVVRETTLNGRFAAYGVTRSEETRRGFRYEAERLVVYDLKRGRTVFAGRANVPSSDFERNNNDVIVTDIVGTASGSVAWISSDVDYDEPVNQVHVRPAGGSRRAIDRSTEIERTSLTRTRDGRTISWVKGGQRQSAPLS